MTTWPSCLYADFFVEYETVRYILDSPFTQIEQIPETI